MTDFKCNFNALRHHRGRGDGPFAAPPGCHLRHRGAGSHSCRVEVGFRIRSCSEQEASGRSDWIGSALDAESRGTMRPSGKLPTVLTAVMILTGTAGSLRAQTAQSTEPIE